MRDLPPTVQMPALDAVLGPMLQAPRPQHGRRAARGSSTRAVAVAVPLLLAAVAVLLLVVSSGPGTDRSPSSTISTTALDRCEADLRAEYDRWTRDPSREINPASCDQPGVSHEDYTRVFRAVGGPVWTPRPTSTTATAGA